MSQKKEFGDFQTPLALAREVVDLVSSQIAPPTLIIEPTAGIGAFLRASFDKWGKAAKYQGFEINPTYVHAANENLAGTGAAVQQRDFFASDWPEFLHSTDENVLVIGNPPWVTSAELSSFGSENLPHKVNFQGHKGLDARTGKANFDIAEWMIIHLLEALPATGVLAMLCKTSTARKVLRHIWKRHGGKAQASLFQIDANKHFGVAVDACLFFIRCAPSAACIATIHGTLNLAKKIGEFGIVDGHLVSNTELYKRHAAFAGESPYAWRSGLKHDASDVMELELQNSRLVNGIGESVDIEPECIFPLLKSSDLGNGRVTPRRFVLVTQRTTGEDTNLLRSRSPKSWAYLESHTAVFDARKSSIYQNRPRFCIFGIGPYSFSSWKVAISGLYDTLRFVAVPPVDGRPVMLDDTCYSLPCTSRAEAELIVDLLNSKPAQNLLRSLIFLDSKRPVTVDVLRRLSLVALAKHFGRHAELMEHIERNDFVRVTETSQLQLVMEAKVEYCTGINHDMPIAIPLPSRRKKS